MNDAMSSGEQMRRGGARLPDELIGKLRLFVEREGYYRAASHFSLSHTTLARAIAGGRVYPGSRALIERGLAALEAEVMR